ncbi:CopD family protein [Ulvibacterium marinum]|uniref:Copper resistance protein CopD n=1 Tax=Ulvibacterium marinum TaxID=2419782 RepID=A0A3B0C2P5_9FLAO|nr:CopD family protein [Ulvibacterium marinum]RKN79350.1 copper resistance protein CopD [Ulvibacterium marinum]
MFLKIVIFIHIVAATIWTGGHLVLTLGFLPKALKQRDFGIIENFESKYEPIGMPALLILVVTGVYMTVHYAPDFFKMDMADHYTRHLVFKFILLIFTLALAVHARFFLIPQRRLKLLAIHILAVTIIAVLFVFTGFSARSGGLL